MRFVSDLPAAPVRPSDGHKGTFGRVLIVGGSRGMSGAAALAGLGALRGGAGLVSVAVPSEILPIVAAIELSYLTIPLATDAEHGGISATGLIGLRQACLDKTAVALGPGLGVSRDALSIVTELYAEVTQPMVVDADALNVLASKNSGCFGAAGVLTAAGPRILTPHPGEFARLTGREIESIQSRRAELAAEFAATHNVIVVLKGPKTVVTDGDRVALNVTGNSGMATGGSGDVLTGLIAALLAQGMPPFDAACLGTHLHGLAGDIAAAELSQPALIASDLPRYLGHAWKRMLQSAR